MSIKSLEQINQEFLDECIFGEIKTPTRGAWDWGEDLPGPYAEPNGAPVDLGDIAGGAEAQPEAVAEEPAYIAEEHVYLAEDPAYIAEDPAYIAEEHVYIAEEPAYIAEEPVYIAEEPVPDERGGTDDIPDFLLGFLDPAGEDEAPAAEEEWLVDEYEAPADEEEALADGYGAPAEEEALADEEHASEDEEETPAAAADARARKKSKGRLVGDILFYTVVVLILLATLVFHGKTNETFQLFDYSAFTVLTGSMEREIPQGSLVITKMVDPGSIMVGDDITFVRSDNATVTHRVIDIVENYEDSGERGFETKGIANPDPDPDIVYAGNLVGVVKLTVPELGFALKYISENIGLVFALLGGVLVTAIAISKIFSKPKKTGPDGEKRVTMTES